MADKNVSRASRAAAEPSEADTALEAVNQGELNADRPAMGTDNATAEKIEVHTTGDFMLQDPLTQEVIEADGSSKVTRTSFIDAKLASGQLKEGSPEK